MSKILLKLYISGQSSRSQGAIANLHRICQEAFPDQYEIVVIDVLQEPGIAETERILVTPTLVKQVPLPTKRLIGDLSDKQKVLLGLDVRLNSSFELPSQNS